MAKSIGSRPGFRVLIAEDSVASRRALTELFKRFGPFELVQVNDGVAALEELESNEFTLLLTDRDMPNMNGLELIRKVRAQKRFENLPIILISSHHAKANLIEALDAGASDYVIKPYDPDVMLRRVQYLMQAKSAQPTIAPDKIAALPDPVSQGRIDSLFYPKKKMVGPGGRALSQDEVEALLVATGQVDDAKELAKEVFKPLEAEEVTTKEDVEKIMTEANQKDDLETKAKESRILSEEEMKNLIRPKGLEEPKKPVITYDFKHPQRVSRNQQRTLENLHANLARTLASAYSTIQRSIVDVDIAFVDQTTYAEFVMSLSNPSCSYTFTMEPMSGPAIVDFSLPIANAFIDRQFGGDGGNPPKKGRPLTSTERTIMSRVITRTLADLEATWHPLINVRVSDAELETNPEFMQVAAPSDTVVLIAFEINMQHASGLVNVCYPYFTLEPIMSYLNVHTWASRTLGRKDQNKQARLDQFKSIQAEVSAICGKGRVSAKEIANIQVGDTIVLETRTDDPNVIVVEDLPLFFAQPGVSKRGQYAVEIQKAIPQEQVRHYK